VGATIDMFGTPSPAARLAIGPSAHAPMARWGALPVLSVVAAIGLLICATADTGARFGAGWSDALLWVGLLTVFVPLAIRLAMPGIPRRERIGSVVLLVMAMYLVKIVQSPVQFVFLDEFAHWRTAADILATGRLFAGNPLSVVSPQYPGLELVTAALSSVTGAPIYAGGVIVLGAARLVLALALFLLIEELSGSARLAGIASLIYAGNPNFTFWSAQFAYESLSLPLAIFIIYVAVRRARSPDRSRPYDIAMLLAGFALVITHHLTSYALLALLAVWLVVALVARRRGMSFLMPPTTATFAIAVWAAAWLFVIAPVTFPYLLPVVGNAVNDAVRFAFGGAPITIKPFFQGHPPFSTPPWERVVAFISVALLVAVLIVSVVQFARRGRTWRRYRRNNSLAYALALGALLYLPSQAARAIQSGTEISNRAGEFLFLPICFLCAIAIHSFLLARRTNPVRRAIFVGLATLVFMGGVIIGMPPWARLPGAYAVSGDTRAIQPESLAASAWLRSTFGTDNKVVADQTNQLIMGSYGGQDMRHGLSWVFFSPHVGSAELDALRGSGVQFIVVDHRVTTMLPIVGYYYEQGEPDAGRHTEPMNPAQLERFDESPALARVFDSGNITIYALDGQSRGALSPTLEEITNARVDAAPKSGPPPL
jgi:hypothetical protein